MNTELTYEEFLEELKARETVEECPVQRTLKLLAGKWTLRVIFELQKKEAVRFNDLQAHVKGITKTMLSNTLKALADEGLVERRQFEEMPVRVEYSLTEDAKALLPVYYELAKWGMAHFHIIPESARTA